jgi:hypothetical protein
MPVIRYQVSMRIPNSVNRLITILKLEHLESAETVVNATLRRVAMIERNSRSGQFTCEAVKLRCKSESLVGGPWIYSYKLSNLAVAVHFPAVEFVKFIQRNGCLKQCTPGLQVRSDRREYLSGGKDGCGNVQLPSLIWIVMIVRPAISPNRTVACEWKVIAGQLSPMGIQRLVDGIVVHSSFALVPGVVAVLQPRGSGW